ncbi:MAG: flagellar basal body P-ring protein FlgI [Planctomycetes bacterium]|nr:flagellar basal body P-ring protein FlgI [Planctomycetota bacterium]
MSLSLYAALLALAFQGDPVATAPVVVPVVPPIAADAARRPAAEIPPSSAALRTQEIATRPQEPAEPTSPDDAVAVRISDLVTVAGVRDNQLQGLGLVTGLNGTGDKGNAAKQALANFIKNNRLNVPDAAVNIGNVALVSVTCRLEPFRVVGTPVDVSVQTLNGATSLFGGHLLQTPLYGADSQVYVVAAGSIAVGGFTASGKAASVTQNHPTVGVMIGGGIVEREVPMSMVAADGAVHLQLRTPNYATAVRIAREITGSTGLVARALDPATVRVMLKNRAPEDAVEFLAALNGQSVAPEQEAVVVINERTGTVVAGAKVRISKMAVTHGNLTISIAETEEVSQPEAFGSGDTVSVDRTTINADVEKRGLQVVPGATSVNDLAASLNRMGVAPRDLVAIFQAFAKAGALHARLEIL